MPHAIHRASIGHADDCVPASSRSRTGLDWFAFFLADLQSGFGPFMAVYLASEKWANADIGLILTAGSLVGLFCQVPAGAIIDATRREKAVLAAAIVVIGLSALALALWPQFLPTMLAQVFHIGASLFIGPALAATTLGLVGHEHLGARLGRNAQFASAGSIFASMAMGAIGYYASSRAVFFVTTMMTVPALAALYAISSKDIKQEHLVARNTNERYSVKQAILALSENRGLLILALGVFFFHLANAGMMPLAASIITMRSENAAAFLVALCVIIPQIIVMTGSASVGEWADHHGRRPLLLTVFGAVAARAFLFAFCRNPHAFVIVQILDGLSAAIFGVLVSVIVADVTRGTGHFNSGLGVAGAAMGLGAATSTALTGRIADDMGSSTAFLALCLVALVGMALMWTSFKETKPKHY